MRKFTVSTIGFLMALIVAACGSSGGGGGTVANTPGPGIVVPPNPNNCQVGQVDAPGYGCLNRNSCEYGYGWVPNEMRCVPGTVITSYDGFDPGYSGRYFGTLAITNRSAFESLLKYANLCDPYWTGWNWGTWSCDYWASRGGFIDLYAYGSNAGAPINLFIGAGTYYYSGQYIGFTQTATVVDYNASQGMQIIGITNSTGQDVGLRLIVESGRLTDHSFKAIVRYGSTDFATINFVRY